MTYVLYHGNCSDGFGAAFAAWLKLGAAAGDGAAKGGEGATYLPVHYGQPVPPMEPGSMVYIVDFSYPRAVLARLQREHEGVVVLDHHHTAEQELAGLEGCTFCKDKSGAVMAWEFFHGPRPVPEFFLYLQDRDLWQWKLPRSREVSMAVRSYPMTFEWWEKISGIYRGKKVWEPEPGEENGMRLCMSWLERDGVAQLRYANQLVESMTRKPTWVVAPVAEGSGWKMELHASWLEAVESKIPERERIIFPAVNATALFSEVAERLLADHPGALLSGYWTDRADGRRQWGLRSRPEYDCSAVAKVFGGGGHKQASGFVG